MAAPYLQIKELSSGTPQNADYVIFQESGGQQRTLRSTLSVLRGTPAGVQFTFDTDTTDTDPGNGRLKFNNAAVASVTALYIDNLEQGGADITAWLDAWDDPSHTPSGYVYIVKLGEPTTFAIFSVTGAVTDKTGYRSVVVSHIASGGTLSNNDDIAVTFSASGDDGSAPANMVSAAATIPDNALVRGDGGARGVQGSGISVTDTDDIVNINQLGVGVASPTSRLHLPQENDQATPTISFGDGDTGFYEEVDDTLVVSIAGIKRIAFTSGTILSFTNFSYSIRSGTPSASQPVYSFRADTDTGMFRADADVLAFSTAGIERARIDALGNLALGLSSANELLTIGGRISLQEQVAAGGSVAGYGQIWVRNDTPNVLMFTDDAGTDFVLNQSGAVSRSVFSDVFASSGRYATSVYGSGAATFGPQGVDLDTGTTASSATATNLINFTAFEQLFDSSPLFSVTVLVSSVAIPESSFFGVGDVSVSGSGHTYTGKQFGFKILNNVGSPDFYATNGNGTTETATNVTNPTNPFNTNVLTAVMDSGNNIKFYINKTLVATHTTNLPAGSTGDFVLRFSVSNNGTTNRGFVRCQMWSLGVAYA